MLMSCSGTIWNRSQHLVKHLPVLGGDADFRFDAGAAFRALTRGAILMASGRVPNTVRTFTINPLLDWYACRSTDMVIRQASFLSFFSVILNCSPIASMSASQTWRFPFHRYDVIVQKDVDLRTNVVDKYRRDGWVAGMLSGCGGRTVDHYQYSQIGWCKALRHFFHYLVAVVVGVGIAIGSCVRR